MNHEKKVVQSLLKSNVQEHRTTVQFQDVWSKYENNQGQPRKFKVSKVGLVACACLLIATPVGASFLTNWYNIELVKDETPVQPADTMPFLKYESYPDYLGTYEQVSLEESEKLAPYKIFRPVGFTMPVEISTGVLSDDGDFNAYWDLFHDGDEWVYVRQSLAENSEGILSAKEMKIQYNFPQEAEVLSLPGKDALAIIFDLGEVGEWIQMLVKNNNEQVINLEIRGNIGRVEIINLAKSYSEN